jgi:hypothetical protein
VKFALSVIASLFVFLNLETKADLLSDYSAAMVVYVQTNSQTITVVSNTIPQFYTNNISFGLYHTFHILISNSDTNVIAKVAIDRSLDGINWIVVATNANTALSNSAFAETTMTGKWTWARYRCYGTNVTGTVFYVGGR